MWQEFTETDVWHRVTKYVLYTLVSGVLKWHSIFIIVPTNAQIYSTNYITNVPTYFGASEPPSGSLYIVMLKL